MNVMNPENPTRLKVLQAFRSGTTSITEIAKCVGASRTTVYHHLANLENEGVITRSHQVGNLSGKPRTRSESGRQGRGVNAFVPRKKKKDDLQKRIDMVVAKAKKRESKTQHDVIRHINAPLPFSNAHKVG